MPKNEPQTTKDRTQYHLKEMTDILIKHREKLSPEECMRLGMALGHLEMRQQNE